ncbi:MAG: cation:proton antiporter, partial [Alphaproteobacteria bacterium]
PLTIGLVLIALVSSMAVVGLDQVLPSWGLGDSVRQFLEGIDFNRTLMEGMLSFLLFAGALHVDLRTFATRKYTIGLLASLGVVMSTALNGLGFWLLTGLVGFEIPLAVCLVFGALISPTDPVAVMAVLKRLKVPPTLEATIAGESLFNDGVAVVIYSILVAIAFQVSGHGDAAHAIGFLQGMQLFVVEAFGGALLGLVAGTFAFMLMRNVDDYVLEIIITLALVTGAYALALKLHVSGPIAMVIAGILIGNYGVRLAMSDITQTHLRKFWDLIDEILNAVLFLLIGFEILVVQASAAIVILSLATIVMVTVVRFVSVGLPIKILGSRQSYVPGIIPVMTWAGLRGGISVALVLALPDTEYKPLMLAICYAVVVFSIVVQGLTIEGLIRRIVPPVDDK